MVIFVEQPRCFGAGNADSTSIVDVVSDSRVSPRRRCVRCQILGTNSWLERETSPSHRWKNLVLEPDFVFQRRLGETGGVFQQKTPLHSPQLSRQRNRIFLRLDLFVRHLVCGCSEGLRFLGAWGHLGLICWFFGRLAPGRVMYRKLILM